MIKRFFHILSNFTRKLNEDHVGAYSGQATLFILISTFPFLMFLFSLIQYLPITESNIMIIVNEILPKNISPTFIRIIAEVFDKGSTTVISISAITALWSASRGFIALAKGLNQVYDIKETRGYLKTRLYSSLYTLVFAFILIITLLLLVFGNHLYLFIQSTFPVLKNAALIIMSLRTVIGFAILIIFFLILFLAIPNRKSSILDELPGAIIAAAGWMIFSYLYSFYIDNIGSFSNMYGSLTTIVFLMLWLYFCMYILFFGAEINNILASKDLQEKLKAPGKYEKKTSKD